MRRNWMKLYVDQCLRGSLMCEPPIIRVILIQLTALSMQEYPHKTISGGDLYVCSLLGISLKDWAETKKRLKELGYLEEEQDVFLINPPDFIQPQLGFRPKGYQFIYELDKYECVYCSNIKDLSIDHLIPQSRGGSNDSDNLVLACRHCNSTKHDRTPGEANMKLKYGRFRISNEEKST